MKTSPLRGNILKETLENKAIHFLSLKIEDPNLGENIKSLNKCDILSF